MFPAVDPSKKDIRLFVTRQKFELTNFIYGGTTGHVEKVPNGNTFNIRQAMEISAMLSTYP
jgi:hypothetical protein